MTQKALCLALAALTLVSGCVTYETDLPSTQRSVVWSGERTRSARTFLDSGGNVRVRVFDQWLQRTRTVRSVDGEYAMESFLIDTMWNGMDTLEFGIYAVLIYPFVAPFELLLLMTSAPLAGVDELLSDSEETSDYEGPAEEPASGVTVAFHAHGESASGTTDAKGDASFPASELARRSLRRGTHLTYAVQLEDQEVRPFALTLEQTVSCVSPAHDLPVEAQFRYWTEFAREVPPGPAAALVASRARAVDPAALEAYRREREIPASMSLTHVARMRRHIARFEEAQAAGRLDLAAVDLHVMGSLLEPHDPTESQRFHVMGVQHAAKYAQNHFNALSFKVITLSSSFGQYCRSGYAEATRYGDPNAEAVFVCLLAVADRNNASWVARYDALARSSAPLDPTVVQLIEDVSDAVHPPPPPPQRAAVSGGRPRSTVDPTNSPAAQHQRAMDEHERIMDAHEAWMREFKRTYR